MSFISLVELGDIDQLADKLEESKVSESFNLKINQRNKDGYTALDMAALLGRRALLELLIDSGADINASNKSGYSAVHYTAVWDRRECLLALIRKGTLLSPKTRHHETPRDVALRYGHLDCVQLLDCHIVRVQLEEKVKEMRLAVTGGDKIIGKWNKDDKSKITAMCNEATEWLLHNFCSDTPPPLHKIQEEKDHFEERLRAYLYKMSTA